jgi:hypothetical protein
MEYSIRVIKVGNKGTEVVVLQTSGRRKKICQDFGLIVERNVLVTCSYHYHYKGRTK